MRTLGAHSQQSGARSQDVRATSLAGSGGQSPRRSRLMQMRDPSEPGKLTVTAFLALMVILTLVWIGFIAWAVLG